MLVHFCLQSLDRFQCVQLDDHQPDVAGGDFGCTEKHYYWADARIAIEKALGIYVSDNARQAQSRRAERQTLLGCVVHNASTTATSATPSRPLLEELHERARQLPPLDNGSILHDGDVLLVARVPYRVALATQDVMHRAWVNYHIQATVDSAASNGQSDDACALYRHLRKSYNLVALVARLIALQEHRHFSAASAAVQSGCEKLPANQNLRNLDRCYQRALTMCQVKTSVKKRAQKGRGVAGESSVTAERDMRFLFHPELAHNMIFGSALLPNLHTTLQNTLVDINCRTRFVKDAIGGGKFEFGSSVARRLAVPDQLALFVRDILHGYASRESLYRTVLDTRGRVHRNVIGSGEQEKCIAHLRTAAQSDTGGRPDESVEQLRKRAFADISAANESPNEEDEPVTFEKRIYCSTCDVPGHHVSDCPRRLFYERLRTFYEIKATDFYSLDSGIFVSNDSQIARYAQLRHHSDGKQLGIMRRDAEQLRSDRKNALQHILPVHRSTRIAWLSD